MCEKEIKKDIPTLNFHSKNERRELMRDFVEMHKKVMELLDEFEKEHI